MAAGLDKQKEEEFGLKAHMIKLGKYCRFRLNVVFHRI
jgi:hypothetical protein